MINLYAPFIYWLSKLPEKNIARILYNCYLIAKSPKINNLIKIAVLLGEEVSNYFIELFEQKYKNIIQKPDYFYTFKKLVNGKKKDPLLKALNFTRNKKIDFSKNNYLIGELIENNTLAVNTLSNVCLAVFNGEVKYRGVTRDIDFLAYGNDLINKKDGIISEFKKLKNLPITKNIVHLADSTKIKNDSNK